MKDHAKISQDIRRRLAVGAEVQPDGGAHFRVWAPRRKMVAIALAQAGAPAADAQTFELAGDNDGYFSGFVPQAAVAMRYGFRLDGDQTVYPDPASRSQPDGPHGWSQIIDPGGYRWRDAGWTGPALEGQVLYELHVGTFTRDGTWQAAIEKLPQLAELGVTTLEVMPVAEFAGEFGWGYDGVNLFAPTRLYGTPDDFRRFVDEAHRNRLAVILDVVFNHFGPVGNYTGQFSDDYVSPRHRTDWGDAINFDGKNASPTREFFLANAGYWIDEFHLDGLRLDAIQAIVDDSPEYIVRAISRRVRESAAGRKTLLIAEDEFQRSQLLNKRDGDDAGALDAAWNDDFHHAARVAMTGHHEGYFNDYHGSPQELISAVKWGYLYQGQWSPRQQKYRGSPALDIRAPQFVIFLQNHDQIANSPRGLRCHQLSSAGRHRALTALLLLAPGTPLLFQGQEFSASAPFHYFADHEEELAKLVRAGRQGGMSEFRHASGADAADSLTDPCDARTFEQCKLDWSERERHVHAYALHQDLLRLRRDDAVFRSQRADRIHGAVLASEAFLLRYLGERGDDRLLLINLGRDVALAPGSEPLLAPPADGQWKVLWSSDDPRYGGLGTFHFEPRNMIAPGHAALVLTANR